MTHRFRYLLFAIFVAVSAPAFAVVPESPSRNEATGNGSTVQFTYGFKILDKTNLKVYVNGVLKTVDTDYTVNGVGNDNGSTIVFSAAPAANSRVVILRDQPLEHTTSYPRGAGISGPTVERDYDKLWMALQQSAEELRRRPRFADYSLYKDITMPDPTA